MEENLNEKMYDGIRRDVKVNIEVHGDFYCDLKIAFNDYLIEGESKESIGKILDNIARKTITSAKEHRLYFMYAMLAGIEEEAKKQGLISKVSVEELFRGSTPPQS